MKLERKGIDTFTRIQLLFPDLACPYLDWVGNYPENVFLDIGN
jgi:hypothetical protein